MSISSSSDVAPSPAASLLILSFSYTQRSDSEKPNADSATNSEREAREWRDITYLLELGLVPLLLVELELSDVLVGLLLDRPEEVVPEGH